MAILLVILKAASFYYYTIFDHMTNIEILNKITKKSSYHAGTFFYNHGLVYNKREFLQIPQQKSEAAIGGVLVKKCVLTNFAKFTGKDLCQSPFFHKVAGLRPSKKFLRTPFVQNTSGRLLLKNNYQTFENLFRIFLIYEFLFRKTGESFIVSFFFVSVKK